MGKPRGGVGAKFAATPVPGASTPTGCATLTIFFFKLVFAYAMRKSQVSLCIHSRDSSSSNISSWSNTYDARLEELEEKKNDDDFLTYEDERH